MIKKIMSLAVWAILIGSGSLSAQCVNDTVFTDVIFLIDNSGSIDSTEYAAFETLITTSIADLQSSCADAQVAVVHYGGFEGKDLAIEYPFATGLSIDSVERQFCTTRNGSGFCSDGGGDDLNYAIGSIIDSMESGALVHDTSNNLSIVILTDAFGFATTCNAPTPSCSLILPTTNIDSLKSTYGVDVTVVGVSPQAEETALGIYASPGGTYTGGLNAAACATSFDGCVLPRKYLEIADFDTNPDSVASIVTSFVSCSIIINTGLTAEAGANQNICSDVTQSVTLTATPSNGMPSYDYAWSNGAGSSQSVMVSPATTTTYYVTITDGNTCTAVDSVTVTAAPCCTGFSVSAGTDTSVCTDLSGSTTLNASITGGVGPYTTVWNDGTGTITNLTVSPLVTTTYTVTITDDIGCITTDDIVVTAELCCSTFMVDAGIDTTICSSTGTASLLAVASGSGSSFGYTWDNGLGAGASKSVSPAVTTTYTVNATDNIGCTASDQVTVTVQSCCAGFSVSAGADVSICTDLSGSTILGASITGGVGPYQTVWNNGIGSVNNPVVSPTITTTYTVTITDGAGCTTTDDVIVTAQQCCAAFTVDAGLDTALCSNGFSSANIMAIATSGSGSSFGYTWDNGLGAGASKVVSPAATTIYTVTATDSIGCVTSDQVTVEVEDCCDGFTVSAGTDRSICTDFSETTTLTTVITGGAGPYLTVWNNGIGVMTNPIVSPTVTTTYTVTITDATGCITTDDVIVFVDPMCGPDCLPDTTFTDVIFLIDNSGSISDSEFAAFENIIMASLGGIRNSCASSRRSVIHYGGANGTSTVIEYALGQTPEISTINRQYCNDRTGSGICVGGGGDDLNNAIGDILSFLDDGSLNRDVANKLSLVILTDAFGFDTGCPQPNCSLILPTTNIDLMKANHDVDVSVVGLSSQAEEVLLGIYASPGGSFNSPLYAPECSGSFDGCTLPRKYVQVEFNTPPQSVADMIADFVSCEVEIIPALSVDAGVDQTICGNLGESATLTAVGELGNAPYTYEWSQGLGTSPSIVVSPSTTMKYFVTVTDVNLCTAIDSVMVNAQECLQCMAHAGTPLDHKELCLDGGQALLSTESNVGVVIPMSFEEVFILTNEELVIIDYSIGHRNFRVNETGLYRIHTLVAEVSNPASPEYLDLSIIIPGESDLFLIVNCIENHDVCADFDFKGRAHFVFGPEDMMCMEFENSINLCNDGIDNDGDGLIDCADEECAALINCTESTLIACNDLTDNDGDGLVDCYDPDCFAFTVCFERGANCNDGIDNDGDGLIDCADNSCDGAAACVEDSPFTCVDGRDNDGDGLVDCADPDCQRFIVCAEYTAEACKDGIDNDFDGLVDCKDTNCKTLLPEYCEPYENTVEKCSDGRDNDFDGLVDCEDPDCVTAELMAVIDNLEIILEVTDATCEGGDNGIIRFYGIAQDPSFQYSIDGGQNFISSYQFTGLAPGDYVVAIKSALGCVHYLDLDIERGVCKEICNDGIDNDEDGLVDCDDNDCNVVDPAGPQIINIQASDCPNYTNGSFEVSGLSSEVEYTIDGGVTYQSSKVFTGLGAISYNLGFRDADGCHHGIIVTIPKGSDADNDNICDDVDVCPGIDDWVIGTPCDDGDPCTVDDLYNSTCDCVGTYLDTDQDGVCDLNDLCPTADDSLIGTACDDGNPCTTGDIYDTACHCAGVVQDSDGDGVCDAEDVCPSGDDNLIGTACDDGDSCTINDVYNTACNCLGTSTDADFDNVCDADDLCPGFDDSLIGTACDDGDPCTTGDVYTTACNCAGVVQDSDGDGICDANDDCPTIGIAIGSICDDGNPATENDVITADCLCLGVAPAPTEICNNNIDDDSDGLVDCADSDCLNNNIIHEALIVELVDAECPEFNNGSFIIEGLPLGTLYSINGIDYNLSNNFSNLANGEYAVSYKVPEGCFQGPIVNIGRSSENIGSACDDGNPATVNDVITPDCECLGVAPEPIIEICNNGIDDDGDGLVDCEDNDCCGESSCESDLLEYDITRSECVLNTGGIFLINPDTTVEYFILPLDTLSGLQGHYGIGVDTLPGGDYILIGIGLCDTLELSFTIENYMNCDPVEICDNGIDDDGDGLVDCADGDCASFDTDGDGICDSADQCQGIDDSLIGTSCDDSNPCTENDQYVISDNSNISLSSPFIGVSANRVVEINQETGRVSDLFILDTAAISEMVNLVYISNECSFYTIINTTSNPTLIKFDWTGHIDVLGPIAIPGSEVGYAESLAYDPVEDILYASVSVSGNERSSGSLISLNRNTVEGVILRSLWIDSEEGDIDDMTWSESGIIYHDGDPENNTSKYYLIEVDFINDDNVEPTLLLTLPYYSNMDLTELDGQFYAVDAERDFYRIDTSTESRILIGSLYDEGVVGTRVAGLVAINGDVTCTNNFVATCGCEGTLIDENDDGECDIERNICDQPHPDYEALMDIYTSTNGANWTEQGGWSQGAIGASCDPCNWNGATWFGVDCSEGRVSAINLRGINLTGNIPESISRLSELAILRMDGNSLGGLIPNSISQLTKLTDLALYNNNLEGEIPVGLSQLSNLKNFAIQNNLLVGEIPSELGLLTLENGAFQLHGNQLSGSIPPELGNLSSQNLTLSNNNLTGEIPEELFNNQNLRRVDFNDNELEGQIPSSLGSLINLEFAHFHNNNLSGCFDQNLWSLCELGQALNNDQRGYNFLGNDLLPWSGDFSQYCAEENQIGASCNDGDALTINDVITDSCQCQGEAIESQAVEICNNNIDDDEDGLIDCEDQSCLIARPFDVTVSKLLDASCPEFNNGSLTGSGQPMGVMISIDGINYQEDSTFSNLTPGLYTVTYRDEGGCYEGDSVLIETMPLVEPELIEILPTSCEYDDGAIVINSEDTTLSYSIDSVDYGSFPGFSNLDTGTYTLYVQDEEGCITHSDYVIESTCELDTIPLAEGVTTSDLNIKVMLEGACTPDGGLMGTELNDGGYLPGQLPGTFFGIATDPGQPFHEAPWFYEGKEGLSLRSNGDLYDANVVDWVLVSLRERAEKSSEIWRAAGLLYNDGTIEFFRPLDIEKPNSRGYHIVIEHRNHLPVMSHVKVQMVGGSISYDFTAQNSFTSILGVGQIQDDQGRYMMVAGNGELVIELSSDKDINARDLTLWLQNNGANSSYFLEDYDMNGDINIKDRILWQKNNGLFTTFETKEGPKD